MPEGNPTAPALDRRRSSSRSTPNGAASASSRAPASASASEYADYDAAQAHPGDAAAEPKEIPGCQCGDVLRGITLPFQCKLFGKGCTPEHPIGPCMVSSEGSLRRVLPLHRLRPRGPPPPVPPPAKGCTPCAPTASCSPTARGGTMMRELIEDVFVARVRRRGAARASTTPRRSTFPPGAHRDVHRHLRRARRVFFPGGDIGQAGRLRAPSTTSPPRGADAAVPHRRLRARGGLPRRRPAPRSSSRWRDVGRARPACASSPATRRSSSAATATASSSTPPASACCARASTSRARYCKPGDVVLLSGTLGDHGIAIISTREGSRVRHRHRHRRGAAQPAHRQRARRRARTRAASATRRAAVSRSTLNELAAASGVSITVDEDDRARAASRCAARARCSATTSSRWRTRARWSPSCPPSRPTPRSPR